MKLDPTPEMQSFMSITSIALTVDLLGPLMFDEEAINLTKS